MSKEKEILPAALGTAGALGTLLVALAHLPKEVTGKFLDVISRGAGTLYAPADTIFTSVAERIAAKQKANAIVETHEILKTIAAETDIRLLNQLVENIDGVDPTKKLEYAEKLLTSPKFKTAISRERHIRNAREMRFANHTTQILDKAIEFLPSSADEIDIEQDWIDAFFNYSSRVSDEDLQTLWAQILANKIADSRSFSKKTLRAIQDVTRTEAVIFVKFCSIVFDAGGNLVSIRLDNKTDKYLRFAGLTFNDLLMLDEFSLVTLGTKTLKAEPGDSFVYFDKKFTFTDTREIWTNPLTRVGSDLFAIVAREANWTYFQEVCRMLDGKIGPLETVKPAHDVKDRVIVGG